MPTKILLPPNSLDQLRDYGHGPGKATNRGFKGADDYYYDDIEFPDPFGADLFDRVQAEKAKEIASAYLGLNPYSMS
tara:strand:+ start:509 stop:739 length:231 start_codon:yes stop_codon:yes gene_type:complete